MSGLFLLVIGGAWVALLVLVAYALTKWIKGAILRLMVCTISVALLLPLPVIDEILGKPQFEQLCRENSTIKLDREKALGKTVYLGSATDVRIKDTWLPIGMQHWQFVDIDTRETVVSYNILRVTGGRLAQALPLSESHVPLTFMNHDCEPRSAPGSAQAFAALGIKYVEPPTAGR